MYPNYYKYGLEIMDTKAVLKYLKLNESNITMILGALVIVVLGFIVINYFRTSTTGQLQTGTSTEVQNPSQPTIKPGKGPVSYTVGTGETLWSIAEKQYNSGYNWVDISQANKLVNPNKIMAGQVLTIPDVAPKVAIASDTVENNTPTVTNSKYSVAKGDSLWSISLKVYGDGRAWTKIATANSLSNPNLIHAGNSLNLPK